MSSIVKTTVRNMLPGDVTVGTSFRVDATPYRLTRTPRGRIVVRGNYPNKGMIEVLWNPSTTITVVRRG